MFADNKTTQKAKDEIVLKNTLSIFLFILFLTGCAKTPTENIIDNHVGQAQNALDYAYNNIEQTKDIIFLENELEMCKTGLLNTKQSYYSEIATCKSEIKYWRLATAGFFFTLCALIFLRIKRII